MINNERVTASMATVAERREAMLHAVVSILPQVDSLRIYLNGYDSVPSELAHDKITTFLSSEFGLAGAEAKFFRGKEIVGYRFAIDDDIHYPPDYVKRMTDAIERYGRARCIGVHAVWIPDVLNNYFLDRWLSPFDSFFVRDEATHILGTGTLAWHSSALRLDMTDFPVTNRVDITLAAIAQSRKLGFTCIAREANWLKPIPTTGGQIYLAGMENPEPITAAVKAIRWQVF